MKRAIEEFNGILPDTEIHSRYQNSAVNYDKYISLFGHFWKIFGFRYELWRKKAIEELNLKEGQTVLDLGCGTGLNFPILEKAVGKTGKIYGVDISKKMLRIAKEKINKNGWENIFLINSDYNRYESPNRVDAIVSTYSIGLSNSHQDSIQKSFQNLRCGGNLVVLGFKNQNLSVKAKLFLPFWLSCIQDYSYDFFKSDLKNPENIIKETFSHNKLKEFYGGLVFLSIGVK